MKTKLLSFMLAFLFALAAQAQITNAGFESWTGTDADGWVSTNGLVLLGNPQSVFQSSKAHSGTSALQMKAVHITNKPPGVFVPDYAGSIFLGKQSGLNSIRGMQYTSRPSQLEFWSTYTGNAGDSASALVALTHWNTTTGNRDTIAIGYYFRYNFDTTYTKSLVLLNYMNAANPDTAILLFSAVTVTSQQAGAIFTIDDLAFTGGNVGLPSTLAESGFTLFPNPVGNQLEINFRAGNNPSTVSVYDVQGRELISLRRDNNAQIKINTEYLIPGVYYLKAGDSVKKFSKE